MTIGQTAYATRAPIAFPGLVITTKPHTIFSKELDADIGFGLLVVKGVASATTGVPTATRASVKLPAAQSDIFAGVTIFKNKEHSITGGATDDCQWVRAFDLVAGVLRSGSIWVQTSGTITTDGTYYAELSSGKLTMTAGTNVALIAVNVKRVLSDLNLALLDIR